MKSIRFISTAVLTALISSLFVPVYTSAENVADKFKADNLIVNKIQIQDNVLTVKGKSNDGITAVLVRPGKDYSDIDKEQLFEVVSDMDYFETENGTFTVEFYEENVENGYSLFMSNGENQLEFDIQEYLRDTVIFVSPNGDDANDGSENFPLKTLEAARKMVQEYNSGDNEIRVLFEAGVYDYESVDFGANDSGFENAHIDYVANGAEFRGTKEIPASQFKKVTNASVLAKLKGNAIDKVLYADLSQYGLTVEDVDFFNAHSAGETASEIGIYVDSKRQMLARYPNAGYMYIDEIINGGGQKRYGTGEGEVAEFYQYDSNLKCWKTAENAYAVGYFGAEYFSEWAKIDAIDGSLSTVKFADWTQYGVKKGYKWYITNLIEELDIPGEWYIDKEAMIIYYFPDEDFGENSKFEIAVHTKPVINVNGASNIDFSGFRIFGTKSDGVKITDGKNISVNNFDISHTMGYGIDMSGNNITVNGCTIHNTYDAGIYVESGGNRNTLMGSGNVISNNHIYKTGTDSGSNWNGGIYIAKNNVGTEVKNNLIHSIKNYSYSFGGNENKFSYNEVWAGNRETGDSIPVYSGRDLSEYGNEILYNYVHDSYNPDETKYWNYGLGSGDDWESGTVIKNNIINLGSKSQTSSLGTHSRDNTIQYNISVGAEKGLQLTDRYKWIKNMFDDDEARQILLATLNKSTGLNEGYVDTEIWQSKYPQISTIYDDIVANNGRFMVRDNIVTDNISVDAPNDIEDMYYEVSTVERNLDIDDYSIFVAPEKHDFRIKNEAMQKYNLNENIINESNFSMNEIGIQGNVEPVSSEFKLTYPYNNSTVDASKVCLSWTEAEFADEYIVEIALDKDFTEILSSKTTKYSSIYPENLSANKTYYWRVKAKNLSKQIGNVWQSENGVYNFTTMDGIIDASNSNFRKKTDKVVINAHITNYSSESVSDAKMYFAFYGDNDAFLGVKINSCSIESGATFNEVYEYSDMLDFSVIKLFLWDDNLSSLLPMPIFLYERQNIIGDEYEITSFEVNGSGWTNTNAIWHTANIGDSVTFNVQTPNAGTYDLYYWVEKPSGSTSLASKAAAKIEITGGISGAATHNADIDMSITGGYVYFGRYELVAPDGTGYATVTVTNSEGDGCLSAVKVKAVAVY